MKALITGAGGFVGPILARELHENGWEVIGADRKDHYDGDFPGDHKPLDVLDVDQVTSVLRECQPNVVFHLAAITFVPEAEKDIKKTFDVNVIGTANVCEAITQVEQVSRLVHVSSAEVYGEIHDEELPLVENTPVRPVHNYGLSKLASEQVVDKYVRRSNLSAVVLRPFNHIGPAQNARFVAASFARQLASIAKGEAEPVIRVGNLAAERDFSHVNDIVRAYRIVAEKGSGTYLLCSGRPVSIQYLLDCLIEISGLDVKIEQDPSRMRAADTPVVYGNPQRAKDDLGWEVEISLEDTLKEIYESSLNI